MWKIVWKTQAGYSEAAFDEFRNWDAALMYARAKLPENKGEPEKGDLPYWVILPASKAYDLMHGKS